MPSKTARKQVRGVPRVLESRRSPRVVSNSLAGRNRASIASNLATYFGSTGRHPAQLAVEIGVASTTLSKWRYGHSIPNEENIGKLSKAIGVPMTKLLTTPV